MSESKSSKMERVAGSWQDSVTLGREEEGGGGRREEEGGGREEKGGSYWWLFLSYTTECCYLSKSMISEFSCLEAISVSPLAAIASSCLLSGNRR